MKLEKKEKFLLLIANIVFSLYLVFAAVWVNTFRDYASKDYLRTRIVDQIRNQTKLTMDSANVSSKDLSYVIEIMGHLSYLYLAVFAVLLIIVVVGQRKISSYYIFAAILLVFSVFLVIFSFGSLFITCLIYFFVGIRMIINASSRMKEE